MIPLLKRAFEVRLTAFDCSWTTVRASRGHIPLESSATIHYLQRRIQPEKNAQLFFAAGLGSSECLRMLLEHKASANFQDVHGGTALMAAVRRQRVECVKLLLEANADVKLCPVGSRRKPGRSALDIALATNNRELCNLIGSADTAAAPPAPPAPCVRYNAMRLVADKSNNNYAPRRYVVWCVCVVVVAVALGFMWLQFKL